MNRSTAILLVLTLSGAASADEVTLHSGARLSGIIRKNDGKRIELEVGIGTVGLDRKDVLSFSEGRTPLHEYYERWETVKGSAKAEDYLDLAKFARANRLSKFLKGLMEAVLNLDGDNEEARRVLGFEKVEGKWMTRPEANRAKGLVEFEGRWMTSAEKELVLSKRLDARIRAKEEAEERRRRREAEEFERQRRAVEAQTRAESEYWYRPSEFWPAYYRGPRRAPYSGYWGYTDAVPTINIFDVIPNPFAGNVKK
ncbi:MAG: hypothetical protein HYY17_14195 [Planctomycetes bacterium]|nr:hypothetical protein [Planctomycetota bacterium]